MDLRTGELITAHQAQNGAFIWEIPNPLYFKILNHNSMPFNMHHDIIDVQIRFNYNLRRALGMHKCFLNFRIWTRLHPPTWRFFKPFRTQVMKYLDNLGVISISTVIDAVHHVLNIVFVGTISVSQDHEIKFNIY
uniref:Replication enhancer n=1 Tax=East African cassava mosaic Cameroon virus TaxID=223262 RepID=Q58WJ1_9GEMI|nr:replication enhancer [East African cassava mosaic Cameroon virus]AGR84103.1 REn [East African cassava mosaic Cameroon virus]